MTARAPRESVPTFLARLRKEAGEREGHPRGEISQEDAARRAGVSREQWNRWEGDQRLTRPNAEKIAAAFSVDPEDLLRRPTRRDLEVRLEEAEAALERLDPILTELANRVKALERQAGSENPQEAAQ